MRHSLAVFLLLTLTACSIFDPLPTGEPSDATSRMTAEQLYQKGKSNLDDGDYSSAIKSYEALQSRFPYGQYAQQSMLEMAYAYYRTGEPDPAISTADRFIKQFPNHPHVDYAYYVKGLATFNGQTTLLNTISGQDAAERDPQSQKDSFNAFKELITRFPNSIYTPDARVRMEYLTNEMARHELHIAEYYLRRGAYIAALNRAQGILTEYPTSPSTRPALDVIIKSYDAMGMTKLRDDAKRVLASNSTPDLNNNAGATAKRWWQFWR
jgi:outer membrane protein assembly factor BamD